MIVIPAGVADAKVSADFFGISAEIPVAGDFDGMGNAGFGSYRVPILWSSIQQTSDGEYDWTLPDSEIRHATENGMRPVPVVFGTPSFVHEFTPQNLYPPTSREDLGEWQDFTEALVVRYGPGGTFFEENPEIEELPVKDWIIWNEQNVEWNWRPKPDPREYAKVVERADAGISAVDPDAKLVLGGMFGYPGGTHSVWAAKYLRAFYRVKGVEKHFDSVNVHPYGRDLATVKVQIKKLRSVMRKARDRKAGIYIGEIGWSSAGPKRNELVVGSTGQAETLKKALKFLVKKRRAWKIGGVLIYAWRDFPAGLIGCEWCPGAGLVKESGEPKPALLSVMNVIGSSVRSSLPAQRARPE